MIELNDDENEFVDMIMNYEGYYLKYKEIYESMEDIDDTEYFEESIKDDMADFSTVDDNQVNICDVANWLIEMYEDE